MATLTYQSPSSSWHLAVGKSQLWNKCGSCCWEWCLAKREMDSLLCVKDCFIISPLYQKVEQTSSLSCFCRLAEPRIFMPPIKRLSLGSGRESINSSGKTVLAFVPQASEKSSNSRKASTWKRIKKCGVSKVQVLQITNLVHIVCPVYQNCILLSLFWKTQLQFNL